MHIPDGYLSPSTCASLYAASAPFWYVALRRVRHLLNTRTVPLLSTFSAFSFVIMMFNLPLPGGTTGHAVGMGVASVVLGPWTSILAISVALLIQALLFGDGGVTAFGANCFNMAIAGSLAAYTVYRLVGGQSDLRSKRRVLAAGLAGYCAINLAALLAAIEFGIQPWLFHDRSGTPLYAPYPLHIAVPAMMLGHLTFGGLAEFTLSAGLIAYLQRIDVSLLRTTAPGAATGSSAANTPAQPTGYPAWPASRKLWIILGLFLILTPLGILAAGSAWGEWHAEDFADAAARSGITAASGGHAPPTRPPSGLEHLARLWQAPLSGYAPTFIRSAGFGYFVSSAAGVGVIILLFALATAVYARLRPRTRIRQSFLEKTIHSLLRVSDEYVFAETLAQKSGFLQRMDARAKLLGLGAMLVAVIAVHKLSIVAALFFVSIVFAFASRIPFRFLAGRVWLVVLGFTGVIAMPALFLTPGTPVAHLPQLDWTITRQGVWTSCLLLLRAEIAATLVFSVLVTTGWNRLLRALRVFGLPAAAILILQMTYRYIFVLLRTAGELFESRRVRLLAPLDSTRQQTSVAAISGVLLDRSLTLGEDIHLAMLSRGFRGDVRLLNDSSMRSGDWLQLSLLLVLSTLAIWVGH